MYLTFDTSTPVTTISLGDHNGVIASHSEEAKSHGPILLPAIEALLNREGVAKNRLTHIGCGVGPGSFTGIRIGMATAKTMAWGLSLPFVGVTGFMTLHIMATDEVGVDSARPVVTILDARRGEVYCAIHEHGVLSSPPRLIAPELLHTIAPPETRPLLIGSGVTNYRELLAQHYSAAHMASHNSFTPEALHRAAMAVALSPDFTSMIHTEPLYIRPSDAEQNLARRLAKQNSEVAP